MERKAFGYSRMVVTYEDGTSAGVCSLHCAVTEMNAKPGKAVRKLEVADRDALTLVDAGTATWVLGGSKRGVMATRAKWAFGTPAAAEAFVRKHGGEIVAWDRALAAAREDVAAAEAQERARSRRGMGCAGPSQARRPDPAGPTPTPTSAPTSAPTPTSTPKHPLVLSLSKDEPLPTPTPKLPFVLSLSKDEPLPTPAHRP
jgi:hypothetical protein